MTDPIPARRVDLVLDAQPAIEGAGVHLRRAFGNGHIPRLDPFLLLDDFHSDNPLDYEAGFPWHPHRGMETVSYVRAGKVEHGDSLGNSGVIGPGDVQWMTAGSGIVHQEMPKGDPFRKMAGLQLWVNLPKADKMMDPRYQEIQQAKVPLASLGTGVEARVIAGTVGNVVGPVKDLRVEAEYLDIAMTPGSVLDRPIPKDHTLFAYTLEGRAAFDERVDAVDEGSLVVFKPGERVRIETGAKPARFLLISGKPLNEPIAWWGPIVMNTRREIETAIGEFQSGTFVKKRGAVNPMPA